MGLLDALRAGWDSRAGAFEAKTADISGLTWSALLGYPSSRSGVAVSVNTALKTMSFLACARVLSEGVAGAEFELLRYTEDRSKYTIDFQHPVWTLIADRPNEWMTSFEFREMGMIFATVCGNAHWYINRVGRDQHIAELIPLLPGRCTAKQLEDLTVVYDVALPNGEYKRLPRTDIMHLRGPMWNPVVGLDVMMLAREAIGLAIATEESHAMLHANGVQQGGVLTVQAGKLDEKQKEALREAFDRKQAGVRNAFRTVVLDMATKFEPTNMKGVDAQHLETRRYQVEEVCRGMRVFPQMIGYTDKTPTFASADAFFSAHQTYSLRPWYRRHIGIYRRDLLSDEPLLWPNFSAFDEMHADLTSLANFFSKALGTGGSVPWMTQDEVRRRQRLNPFGGSASQLPASTNPLTPGTDENPDPTGGQDAGTA